MKIYTTSMNGILDEYKSQIEYAPPLDADKILVWQDCVGSFKEMIGMCKRFFPKPVYTIQHGRRSSRDYDRPLKRPFQSDMFLAWGKWDYENMRKLGLPVEIVGCPLNTQIRPKITHKEKAVLFLPVNTGKEEPDNIKVYCELLKMKLGRIQAGCDANYEKLRAQWDVLKVTKNGLCDNFTVLTANLPWHDQKFYTEGVLRCYQDSPKNNQLLFDLFRNIDAVVSTDEGTAALFAVAHDVPVVVVDGFEYRWAEGCTVPVTNTPGMRHCKLEDLQAVLEDTFAHPEYLKAERREIAENEMSVDSIPNPVSRIHTTIGSTPV